RARALRGTAGLRRHHPGDERHRGIAGAQRRRRPRIREHDHRRKAAGLTAAYAISMALYERERSGRGQAIEVPMFETIVSFTLLEHMAGATFVPTEHAMGYERVLSPNRKPYRTKDGYIGLLPYTTAQWQRFFTVAGETALAA